MSAASCQGAIEQVGSGIAASLQGVDCAASNMAAVAFGRLFGSNGSLVPALTIVLTLYIALFAIALITGRSRIGVASLIPRMATLGLVLTFATSWIAYQSVVWNLAAGGPDQLAGILTGTRGNATFVFAQKIDVVFQALIQASAGQSTPDTAFSPPGLMWLGGTLFLLATVGILATTRIALAILLALGPVFFVFALFPGTRGLFAGWLKGVVMLAIAPLFAVIGGSLMLELSVPVLSALVAIPGQIDAQAAMAFFMIAAVHTALMVLTLRVAGTIVAGWSVFGLVGPSSAPEAGKGAGARALPTVAAFAPGTTLSPAGDRLPGQARQVRVGPVATAPANDAAPASAIRQVRFPVGDLQDRSMDRPPPSRVRNLVGRFRPPFALKTEKPR